MLPRLPAVLPLWEDVLYFIDGRIAFALVMVATLVSPAAKMAPLGVVTQAKEALLSNGELSAGTSIFDGDQLSTGMKGALSFRSGSATIFLSADSGIRLRGPIEGAEVPSVELGSGTVVFSTAHVSDMAVDAESARIRAAANKPTVGQIRILGPRTLQVYARRGELIFSYGEESERIREGEAYRIVLLPPGGEDDANNKPGESDRVRLRRENGTDSCSSWWPRQQQELFGIPWPIWRVQTGPERKRFIPGVDVLRRGVVSVSPLA